MDTSHVLVDGLGDRQGLYVAMSRGRDGNYAYCITRTSRATDVRQGSLPAPELARLRRLTREHAALEPEPPWSPGKNPLPPGCCCGARRRAAARRHSFLRNGNPAR